MYAVARFLLQLPPRLLVLYALHTLAELGMFLKYILIFLDLWVLSCSSFFLSLEYSSHVISQQVLLNSGPIQC